MEIVKFLEIIQKNYKLFLVSSLLGSLLFCLIYIFIPQRFTLESTLYIYPINSDLPLTDLTGETNYSRNIVALSNSPEFKEIIRESNLNSVTFLPLVGVVGGLKLKEVSPNILSLSISGESKEFLTSRYNIYLNNLIDFTEVLKKGNVNFEVTSVTKNPIIYENYKNFWQFMLLGFISGFFVTCIYFYIIKK